MHAGQERQDGGGRELLEERTREVRGGARSSPCPARSDSTGSSPRCVWRSRPDPSRRAPGEQVAAAAACRWLLEQVAALPADAGGAPHRDSSRACGRGSSTSPSARARAGRSARSSTETIAAMLAAERLRARGRREQLVERAALVGLDVREGHPAQARHRHHGRDRLPHQREHPARPGVEEQRLLVHDQVLVEAEAAGQRR